MKWFIGIDPGLNGGLAVIGEDGLYGSASPSPMPETIGDLAALFANFPAYGTACIEKVASSPQMGVRSVFTFGRNYGLLLMGLAMCHIPYTEVPPGVWQRTMGCLSKGDKNVTKNRAQQLFPDLHITHKTADALLLAEYCRRKELGL